MKEKVRKALLDAGLNITGESHSELHLENNIAVRVYNHTEEGLISWSVEDFRSQAKEFIGNRFSDLSDPDKKEIYHRVFDESKFPKALEDMLNRADHSLGITWETLDFYLHEYCLREEEF